MLEKIKDTIEEKVFRGHKRWIFGFLITALAFWIFYIFLNRIGFSQIYETLINLNWIFFLAAIAIVIITNFIIAVKWKQLLDSVGHVSYKNTMLTIYASNLAYVITPGKLGGDPVKTFYMSRFMRKTKIDVLATVLFEKGAENIALQMLYVISFFFVLFVQGIPIKFLWILVLFLVISVVWIIFRFRFFKVSDISEKTFFKMGLKMIYFFRKDFVCFSAFELYAKDKMNRYNILIDKFNKDMLNIQIALSAMKLVISFFAIYLLFLATGTYVNFFSILAVQSISLVIATLTMVPGGIGILESLMIGLYVAMGIDMYIATTVALLNRVLIYFFAFVVGGISMYLLNGKSKVNSSADKIKEINESIFDRDVQDERMIKKINSRMKRRT